VTQLAAVSRAVDRAGFKLVAAGLTYCIQHPEDAEASGYPIDAMERMFMNLS